MVLYHKRILQVLPTLSAGGVEQGTIDVAQALVEEGAQAYVASSGGDRVPEIIEKGGQFIKLPLASKNPLCLLGENVQGLIKVIREHQIDLVHARSRGPAWSAYLACRFTKTPFVTTFHGTYNFSSYAKKFYNSSMVRGDHVIAISGFIQQHIFDHYQAWLSPEKVTRIYRGIDTQAYCQKAVSQDRREFLRKKWHLENAFVFLMPGRLTRWKGQEGVLRALALLSLSHTKLVIVGSDQGRCAYRQELLALTHELGLKNRVRIVEHCEDMPAAYAVADCVVHASTDPEAFGRVVAEGQSMGLPCLVSNLGAPREIIEDKVTGWQIKAGCVESLAKALHEVCKLSDQQRQTLAQKARQRVKTFFSLEEMCAQTFKVYEKVLKNS